MHSPSGPGTNLPSWRAHSPGWPGLLVKCTFSGSSTESTVKSPVSIDDKSLPIQISLSAHPGSCSSPVIPSRESTLPQSVAYMSNSSTRCVLSTGCPFSMARGLVPSFITTAMPLPDSRTSSICMSPSCCTVKRGTVSVASYSSSASAFSPARMEPCSTSAPIVMRDSRHSPAAAVMSFKSGSPLLSGARPGSLFASTFICSSSSVYVLQEQSQYGRGPHVQQL